MKTQFENLSAQESLDIITSMINQAKGSVQIANAIQPSASKGALNQAPNRSRLRTTA